ncbi:MAG: hypothetical protein GEU99_02895 [Luteitalea sp.]|nr:hypothetical protein [Luteitalea sp.]
MIRRATAVLIALFAVAIAARPAVFAHEGDDHKVMGTVKSIRDGHIEVQDQDSETTTFMVTDKTKIRRGKVPAELADIEVDERVVVIGAMEKKTKGVEHPSDHDAMMTAKEIRLGAR